MASRLKEDEKNEKIIRSLLRLPANKRCINCNSLGPQYVCTNFWTFICTNCSGIHREFTHRVKSVSMAKFTSQEVNALQEGGNEQAKELFLKDWDSQRHSFPDSSNVDKLRTFIKHVYVDRRYSGERSADRPPRVKGGREDYEQRRQDASLSGSRSPANHSGYQSPQYDETYGQRYGGSPVSGGRNDDKSLRRNYGEKSPAHELGQPDYKRSPGRLEADDRQQDDRYASANQNKFFEDSRLADGPRKTHSSSPNLQNQEDVKVSPPMIRPVRDILGEDTPALVVGEPPKSSTAPAAKVQNPLQTSTAATNISTSNIKQPEQKEVYLSSLIDFGIVVEPASARKSEESVSQQTTPTTEGNWAFFDKVTEQKEQKPETMLNSLVDTLNLLNAPGVTPVASDATVGTNSPSKSAAVHHASQHNEPSLFSVAATASQSTVSSFMPPAVETSNNLGWATSVPPNTLETVTMSTGSTQASEVPYVIPTGESPQQLEKMEAKSTGRKELPVDLFAALYPTTHAPAMGWQTNPSNLAAGYGMQYHMPMVFPQVSYTPRLANPFDVSNQPRLPHSSTFPSMESLQGALPSAINSSGLVHSSSFGANPLPQWMPQQQPDGYMGQQILGSMPHHNSMTASQMGNQGSGEAANRSPALGPPTLDQQLHSTYSQPSSFPPRGGNPFG